jgi:surface protein
MSIITEVERIQQAKQDLKNKLLEKGVDVGDKKIDEYAPMLDEIQSGGENTLKKLLDYTKTTAYMFSGVSTITDASDFLQYSDTENVTNMSNMFYSCTKLTTIPQLNTSNVTNMGGMFRETKITTIPLLDTSKATDMNNIFNNCKNLIEVPQLNTSNVTKMDSMFHQCYMLTTIPPLVTNKATGFYSTFTECRSLIKIDISYYNVSSSFDALYCYDCRSLKAVIIRGFGTSYVLKSGAFNNCYHILGTGNSTYNPEGLKDGYIYVPRSMVDTLKSATNWSTYADQIRALEDYTIDGTTTGELDESKVNA